MELHGCKGCGSAAVEALLEIAGFRYDRSVFEWDDRVAWDRLRAINPLAQVPTLILDDGTVMTESAGIALWIADGYPALMPVGASERALTYRWMVSFATNVYTPIVIGDFPSRWVDGDAAQDSLKAKALGRLRDAWLAFEARIEPAPYLIGDRLSVLDVYVAMVSRWRPGRDWITAHCPKAMAAIAPTEAHPIVAAVWARNFG
ncbi:MAG: glutathione S-transferase family protein [Burkholderiaceae bacterium]